MKLDKDTLLKNRFWVLLGVFFVLWPICWCVVVFGTSVQESEKKFNQEKDALGKMGNPKNASWEEALKKKEDILQVEKEKKWHQEAKLQEDVLAWPQIPSDLPAWEFSINLQPPDLPKLMKDKKFPEVATFPVAKQLHMIWPDLYTREVEQLAKHMVPDKDPPFYFKDNDWKTVLNLREFKDVPAKGKGSHLPTPDEIWYTQEDFCVTRELMETVKKIVDDTGRLRDITLFRRVESPLGFLAFRNPEWQLDLELKTVGKGKEAKTVLGPGSKITNIRIDGKSSKVTELTLALAQRDLTKADALAQDIAHWTLKLNALPVNASATLAQAGMAALSELKGWNEDNASLDTTLTLEKDTADVPPAGGLKRKRYRNASWELELLLEEDKSDLAVSITSKLTNVHPARKQLPLLDVKFEFRQAGQEKSVPLVLQGEPASWDKPVKLETIGIRKAVTLAGFKPGDPIDVIQVPTWQNSPVKRIDALNLAQHSYRTAPMKFEKLATAAAPTEPPPMADPNNPPPPADPNAPQVDPALAPEPTLHGIEQKRYVQRSTTVRRMDVCVSLIIDQSYLQDVLVAFEPGNTRLRFDKHQVIWQHAHGIMPPGDNSKAEAAPGTAVPPPSGSVPVVRPPAAAAGPAPPPRGVPGPDGRVAAGPQPRPRGEGSRPAGFSPVIPPPGTAPATTAAATEEENPNLIQVDIYGFISLYEHESQAKTEPGKAEPGKAEPGKADVPAKVEPAKTEPGKTEVPAKVEPAKTEPAKTEPAKPAVPAKPEAPK